MLTLDQCEKVYSEGEEIGRGADRSVYWHPDFPYVVVKKAHSTLFGGNQNDREYQNYRDLKRRAKDFPHLRLPRTLKVGKFIVQQYVRGEHPSEHEDDWDEALQKYIGPPACDCLVLGLPECYTEFLGYVTNDDHNLNVKIYKGKAWLVDMGFVSLY